MRLLKGEVISDTDPENEGIFKALEIGGGGRPIDVIYTSPFFYSQGGGMYAIPPIGSMILIIHDYDQNLYFYLSTIVKPSKFTLGNIVKYALSKIVPEKWMWTPNGVPRAITFKDQKGAGLKISNYYVENDTDPVPLTNKVILRSTQGHELLLSDTPSMDCVMLKNKDGDFIRLSSNGNNVDAANTLKVSTKSTQQYLADKGEMLFFLKDGRDITIQNNSTGVNTGNKKYLSRNINLRTSKGDINLFTEPDGDGSVFIKTNNNGIVQISAGGDVTIFSGGNVKIKTTGDFTVAAENISLNANSSVNIRSGTGNATLTSNSGVATVGGGASTSIGLTGKPLALNSSITLTAPTLNIGNPVPHAYERD